MSYRYAQVRDFYPEVVDLLYGQRPELRAMDHASQQERLLAAETGSGCRYSPHLGELGVDAAEIATGVAPLAGAWARERGGIASDAEMLVGQLRARRVEVVFFQNAFAYDRALIAHVRHEVPTLRLILGWCSAPFTERQLEQFAAYDVMVTCSPAFVTAFRARGIDAHLVTHAFDASLLPAIEAGPPPPRSEVVFSGSLTGGPGYHNLRREVVERLLASDFDFHFYGSVPLEGRASLALKRAAHAGTHLMRAAGLGGVVESVPLLARAERWGAGSRAIWLPSRVRRRIRPPRFGLEMLRAIRGADVGLNVHIDAAGSLAGNMRLFEVTGVGTCLLTDRKSNLADIFELDSEVVTFGSSDECLERLRWLRDHPSQREAIARAGQARTLRDHTYARRAAELDGIIRSRLALLPAARTAR